jgi:hypothetical protein
VSIFHNSLVAGTTARVLSTEYKIDNLVTASANLTQAADLLPQILAQPVFHSLPVRFDALRSNKIEFDFFDILNVSQLFKVLPVLLGSPRNEAKFFKDNKPTRTQSSFDVLPLFCCFDCLS